MSISACLRDDMEHEDAHGRGVLEQHEQMLLGRPAIKSAATTRKHNTSDPLGLNNNVTEIAIGQSSQSPPRRALCVPLQEKAQHLPPLLSLVPLPPQHHPSNTNPHPHTLQQTANMVVKVREWEQDNTIIGIS
jgi:hypothetical protein